MLCGGKSTRMGHDKGLLIDNGITWAEKIYQLLSQRFETVYLSVNHDQLLEYKKLFPEEILILDADLKNINGSLKGLITAHIRNSNSDFFCMPCDVKDLDLKVIDFILEGFIPEEHQVRSIRTPDGFPHPLIGIYTAVGLNRIKNWFIQGQLVNRSIRSIIKEMKHQYVEISPELEPFVKNFNSMADL